MARYDRIARLDPPPRTDAFPGWLVLRDLEGRERDPELSRRARLRFLALRPARRLLARGIDAVEPASLERQLAGVRAEVDRLPEDDREREVLSTYLGQIAGRVPAELAAGSLALGAASESAGHDHSAEEFYRTGLEMAVAHGLKPARILAALSLGRLYGRRRAWREAVGYLESAVELAEATGDAPTLAASLRELAVTRTRSGDAAAARDAIAAIGTHGDGRLGGRWDGVRAAALCALELADGRPGAALEAGWSALERLAPSDPAHSRALLDLAAACLQLRLREAAEACLLMATQVTTSQQRAGLPPSLRTDAEPGVGLWDAGGVEELLNGLELRAETELEAEVAAPSVDVRSIAERIASLGRERVPSGS
jgi:tetratricopeptide (TPR) repeat protein